MRDDDVMSEGDLAFDGVLPSLDADRAECACGCGGGANDAIPRLPADDPAPDRELAVAAAASRLVERAVRLATWLGNGRDVVRGTVTGAEVLATSEVEAALAEFGLGWEDLPSLHSVWRAAREAGVVTVGRGRAVAGPALAVWQPGGSPQERVRSWALLLGGYLRSVTDGRLMSLPSFGRVLEVALAYSVPVLYATGGGPVHADCLAEVLDEAVGEDLDDEMFASIVCALMGVWTDTGVVERLELPDGDEPWAMRVTSLGRVGLARMMRAHGWTVPVAAKARAGRTIGSTRRPRPSRSRRHRP